MGVWLKSLFISNSSINFYKQLKFFLQIISDERMKEEIEKED
jgi:hypothetical protein